ncbi:flagellar hook-length control protein FliK [Alphaproteobacteria bacterium]|nr:flagellar hook-length control protein FliK [Alphaproteobacteria bacterium]
MPIITASSSSDFSTSSSASSAGEERENDVLFAALFGAVVSSEDTEDTDISLEMVPDVMSNGQADAQVGKGKFEEPLLFSGNEQPGLDNNGISLIPQQLNVDDEGDALSPNGGFLVFEEKEELDAGILAAAQTPVQAPAANAGSFSKAGDRPLTTQLLTEIAEDIAPEHVVIKQKMSMTTAQIAEVDSAKLMPLQLDKALSRMLGSRQNLRAKPEISGPISIEMPEAEFDLSLDKMTDALTFKTATQAGLPSRLGAPQLPITEITTHLQSGISSQVGSSAGNQSAGGQTSGSQTSLASSMAENWLEMLDMQDENWAEQLVKRVERNLVNAKEGIDFELNPRSLGKLHVNLSLQHNEAQLQMRTETSQAAQMITDAQSRLSAMLEDAGMKLAYLGTSTQSNGNGANGQQSGNAHHARQNSGPNNDSDLNIQKNNDATDASNSLVNIKA